MSNDYQVTYRGIFHDSQGYCIAAQGYALGLDALGVDVRIEPLSYGTKPVKQDKNAYFKIKELINKPQHLDKKQILVVHVKPWGLNYQQERQRFHKVINNVVFEPEPIHNEWVDLLNRTCLSFYILKYPVSNECIRVRISGNYILRIS